MKYDIIIAGCGPTGATFANYFGKAGLNVLIFDQENQIIQYPRAVHIDEDVIRIFQELGLYDEMKKNSIKPFDTYALVDKRGKNLFKFHPNCSISEEIPDSNWILQPEIEKHLRAGFEHYPTIHFLEETILQKLHQNESRVQVELSTSNESPITFEAKFLIACDGAKSQIRKLLQIEINDFGFNKEWFVVDSKHHGSGKFSEDHKQFCDPMQPITYVNGVRDHFRWEFMISKSDLKLNEDQLADKMIPRLKTFFPINEFEVIRKKKYTFHAIIAKEWRKNRIFLAGDAAHQMPPFLGQGMCSGLKDAKNLAWKLTLACHQWNQKTDQLLDTYYSERAPQVERIIKLTKIVGNFIQFSNPYLAPLRNAILKIFNYFPHKPVDFLIEKHLYGIDINNFQKLKHPLVGKRFPQPIVSTSNGSNYFDAAFPQQWILLCHAEFKDQKIESNQFLNQITLCEGKPQMKNEINSDYLNDWLKKSKADFVIIRPDKFIFNLGKTAQLKDASAQLCNYLEEIYHN